MTCLRRCGVGTIDASIEAGPVFAKVVLGAVETSPACYFASRGEEGPPRERVGGDVAGKCSGKSLRAEEEGG